MPPVTHFEYCCKTCNDGVIRDNWVQRDDVDGNRKLVHVACGQPVRIFVRYNGEAAYYSWNSPFPDPAIVIKQPVGNVPAVLQPQQGARQPPGQQQR